MRRIIILCMTLAMSAFAFNNCAYPDWQPEPSTGGSGDGGSTVTPIDPSKAFLVVATVAQTKTEADAEGVITWAEGDQINVFHGVSGETAKVSDGAASFDAEDTFNGQLASGLKEKWSYDWFMFYPYTEDLALVENTAAVTIGSTSTGVQTQSAYGDKAHVSGEGMPLYGSAMGVEEGKTPEAELSHLASVMEVNIINCMPAPVNISEVKVTAGEAIVGSFVVDFVKGTVTSVEGAVSNTAVLNINDEGMIENGATGKFYLVVKPFTATVADGLKISVNGAEKSVDLKNNIVFAPGQVASFDYTYYDITKVEDSLVGAYKIHYFWVYGGTGPEWNCGGWVDLHNKYLWFDQTTGHGIAAERDNYIEFTLTDLLDGGTKTTGKCINWAGVDGKNWSTFFHNASINGGNPTDGSNFYRQIPIGESTWVRDYSKTPNTITFTDSKGKQTVVEMLEPKYTFVPGYNDSQASANTRVFPRNPGSGDNDDLTFHAILSSTDNWDVAGSEIDKVYYRPRDFFIDVDKVDEIPAEAKTSEPQFDPTVPVNPYPETMAGTYKYSNAQTFGGVDGNVAIVGILDKYSSYLPSCNNMKNDVYVFTKTGTDGDGNETGTVDYQAGDDGSWDYQIKDPKTNQMHDATAMYAIFGEGTTTSYVYDRNKGTITLTYGDKVSVVKYLPTGTHDYKTTKGYANDVEVTSTFALDYEMGYTTERVAGYSDKYNNFARFYVWARNYILHLQKQ